MIPFQVQFEAWLRSFTSVGAFMQTQWAWPAVESVHFIGLTLLFGSIAAWDLRLVGVLKEVPVAAFHKLVPFAILGFAINVASGFDVPRHAFRINTSTTRRFISRCCA